MNQTDQKELLIVVDEEDNILDYLPRSKVHQKMLLHRTISVVVFTDNKELVIQIRGLNKDTYPGFYSNAVGGHVTKGQSYEEAAIQEALEEIGLTVPLSLVTKKILEDPKHRTMTSIFKAKSNGPFKKNPDEVKDIIKVKLSDIPKIIDKFYPTTKQVMKVMGIFK